MTHISPGKHPFLERLSFLFNAQLWLSGHMDPLCTNVYGLFSLFDDTEWVDRARDELNTLVALYLQTTNHALLHQFAKDLLEKPNDEERIFNLLKDLPFWSATLVNDPEWQDNNLNRWEFPEPLKKELESIKGSHGIAKSCTVYLDQFSKSQIDKAALVAASKESFSPVIASNSFNPGGFPKPQEIEYMRKMGTELLTVPERFRKQSNEKDPAVKVTGRGSCDFVKTGPTFMNLPDCYLGGYVLIETDPQNRSWTYQTGGLMPRAKSIVSHTPEEMWKKFSPAGEAEQK